MKHEKPELSRKNPYFLPKYRYLELKNFCFQYNDWKRALARLDGWRAQEGDMGGIRASGLVRAACNRGELFLIRNDI